MLLGFEPFIFVKIEEADARAGDSSANDVPEKENEVDNRFLGLPISNRAGASHMFTACFLKRPGSASVRVKDQPLFVRSGEQKKISPNSGGD